MISPSTAAYAVGELTISTEKLDKILISLSNKIQQHDRAVDKISQLENNQSLIRKDLHFLKLTLSSRDSFQAAGIGYDKAACEEEGKHDTSRCHRSGAVEEDESKSFDIASRSPARSLQTVNEQLYHSNANLENRTLRDLRRDVVGLKAIITQLQDDFNIELSNAREIVTQVDGIKNELNAIESERRPSANSAALIDFKRKLDEKYDSLVQSIRDLEERSKDELDCRMNAKAADMKSTFSALEESFRKRRSQWDTKLGTFAKKSDLAAMVENFDNEYHDNQMRLDVLEKSTLHNERCVLRLQHQASFITFQKCYLIWRKRMQQDAWSRWCTFLRQVEEQRKKEIKKRKKVRKLLIRHWFGRKQQAWKRWYLYVEWHKRVESLKQQAVKLIYNQMQHALTLPVLKAFNELRRFAVTEKITQVHIGKDDKPLINCGKIDVPENDDDVFSIQQKLLPDLHSNHYDLSELLSTFKNDKDGAIHTLAEEINNIRIYDIKKVRRDMQKGDKILQETFEKSIDEEVSQLESNIATLENKVEENFDFLSTQLPEMKSHISEMRSSLHGTINRVKIIEQTHRDRIELLCEGKETSDEKIAELESELSQAQIKIRGLEYNNDRSQNIVNTLLQKMNDFEQSQIENSKLLADEIIELRQELKSVNSKLQSSDKNRRELHDSLVTTQNDLIQAKIASESRFACIHDILDAHGIRKPKWDIIIHDGVLYEKIAKEKNYVVQLNSVFDGAAEINVINHIASFAHDYSNWIAFCADHEALELVVGGKNPDDAIYVEDDIEARRKNLVER